MLTRRSLLRATLLSGGALFVDLAGISRASGLRPQRKDPFASGNRLGTLDFLNEGSVPFDGVQGSELDGRLYSDLSALEPEKPTTPTETFYIRTRASELLPDMTAWQVNLGGLVEKPINLGIESLQKTARPMGTH